LQARTAARIDSEYQPLSSDTDDAGAHEVIVRVGSGAHEVSVQSDSGSIDVSAWRRGRREG
jgi:hypothetical protein